MRSCRSWVKSWEHDQLCQLQLSVNTFAASIGNGWLLVHETTPHQHKVERLPLLALCHQLVSRFRHLPYSIKAHFLADYFLFPTKNLTDFLKTLLVEYNYYLQTSSNFPFNLFESSSSLPKHGTSRTSSSTRTTRNLRRNERLNGQHRRALGRPPRAWLR